MRQLAFLLLAMLSVPALASPPLSVRAAVDQIHALNGRSVTVRGWLVVCEGYSCLLAATPLLTGRDSTLSLACCLVDGRAKELLHRRITIEGILDGTCRQPPKGDEIIVCTDRAPDFTPTRVIKIDRRARAGME